MADIFFSWSTPDKSVVEQLRERLGNLHLDFFEYSDQKRVGDQRMQAGDSIHQRVIQEINKAQLAILCMSEQTVNQEWVRRELDWCYQALTSDDRPMQVLMPIKVGPLDMDNLPDLLQEIHMYIFDLSLPDTGLNELVMDIQDKLGAPQPVIIPATVISMTKQECVDLPQNLNGWPELRSLCEVVGMNWKNGAPDELLARYGDRSEMFTPYSDVPLVQTIEETISFFNENRKKSILLNWYSREMLASGAEAYDDIVHDWRFKSHLLVIDTVSLLNTDIRADLKEILAHGSESPSALLWVPPYTRHTTSIEKQTGTMTRALKMTTHYKDWIHHLERKVTFDTSTEIALRRWLNQTFENLAAQVDQADQGRIHDMVEYGGSTDFDLRRHSFQQLRSS